jgi:hypothetical protein
VRSHSWNGGSTNLALGRVACQGAARQGGELYYASPIMAPKPIRFDHIALALERLADAPAVLAGALGGAPVIAAASRGFNFAAWRYAGGGKIEVLEPAGADGFLHRFLAQRGPGIHHVTFKVPSLHEACDRARARGYEIVGFDDSRPSWKEGFLHPRQALGIVVQFAESAGPDEPPRPRPLPPVPADPPPAVTILGLRMRARGRQRAETQWAGILEAEAVPADGAVVFRWPGSPMRIVVEIDPAAEEGPLAIEFASDRPVRLPGPDASPLGGLFVPARGPDGGSRA